MNGNQDISIRVGGLPIDINGEPLIIARNKDVEEWQLTWTFDHTIDLNNAEIINLQRQ